MFRLCSKNELHVNAVIKRQIRVSQIIEYSFSAFTSNKIITKLNLSMKFFSKMTKSLFTEGVRALFCFNNAPSGDWFGSIHSSSAQLARWTPADILHGFPVLILVFLTASQ